MATPYLPLKGEYFDQIKIGEKVEKYRLATPFWAKRIEGRKYDQIELAKGYPPKGDTRRRIARPWLGYRKTTITHPHFGPDPVEVYAIRINPYPPEAPMTMRISQLIACLKAAQEKHGDLPVYTTESDIKAVDIAACRDGVQRTNDGVPETPNELVLDFVPCD